MLSLQISHSTEEEMFEVCFTVKNDREEQEDKRHVVTSVQALVRAVDDLDALSACASMLGEIVKEHCRGENFSETKPALEEDVAKVKSELSSFIMQQIMEILEKEDNDHDAN